MSTLAREFWMAYYEDRLARSLPGIMWRAWWYDESRVSRYLQRALIGLLALDVLLHLAVFALVAGGFCK